MKLFKSPVNLLLSAGLLVLTAQSASAQGFLGDIQMGHNGPVGVINGSTISSRGVNINPSASGLGNIRVGANGASGSFTTGLINGRVNVGNGGIQANTNLGSFGFDMGGGGGPLGGGAQQGSIGGSGGFGPMGQAAGGFGSAGGFSGGTAYSSQGDTGDYGRESMTTSTKFQGNSGYTRKNNNAIYERTRNNLLSTFSVDPSPVPSASFNYGFPTGGSLVGGGLNLMRRGWYTPPTSTSSFDGNTVSP